MAAANATSQVVRVNERYRLRYREEEVPIRCRDFVIGRAPDSQLRLDCGLVSRQHVRLRYCEAGLLLEDLGSRNGVMVNQRKVSEPVLLNHGDVIVVGVESLEFVDSQVLHLPANLSTLPPPPIPVETADMQRMESVTQPVQTSLLSARERQVLELIALGHTQREIAQQLCISVKTIETHRARIAEKLDCHSRAEFVTYAFTAGILRGR
jgi:DNA-binding CsgD family transcriptional regulator